MTGFARRSVIWAVGSSLLTIGGGAIASVHSVPYSVAVPIYMLLTIVVAWRAGFRASLLVAVASTLGLDFFFTEPRYTLEIDSPRDFFALGTFAATSTLVSHLSNRIRVKSALEELFAASLGELHSSDDRARIKFLRDVDGTVCIDPDLAKLIIAQLLENGLKYSSSATKVEVDVSWTDADLNMSIHDQGSYIPVDEHALVFERYYRGVATEHKASGTGIGLSVAKNAAEAMGGKIWLESTLEAGTTSFISLPLERV